MQWGWMRCQSVPVMVPLGPIWPHAPVWNQPYMAEAGLMAMVFPLG